MARKPITITPGRWVFDPMLGTALITNAALMAAAPALLRACQAAVGYLTAPSITDEQDALDKSNLLTLLATALFDATHVPEVPA